MYAFSFHQDAVSKFLLKYNQIYQLIKSQLSWQCLIGPFAEVLLGGGVGVGNPHGREM